MHGGAGCLWRSVKATTTPGSTPTLPLWISMLLMTQSAPLRRWASVASFCGTVHSHHVMHYVLAAVMTMQHHVQLPCGTMCSCHVVPCAAAMWCHVQLCIAK